MQHHALVQDCFFAILRLRTLSDEAGAQLAEDVHAILTESLGAILAHPERLGVSGDDAEEMAYAIAALADEVALSQHDAMAALWAPRPLQTVLFAENQAGERFFERLDLLLSRARARRAAIMTYYTALSLGFEGRFCGPEHRAELTRVRQLTQRALQDAGAFGDETLSPRAIAPQHTAFLARRSQYLRRLRWGLVAVAAGILLLATGLKIISEGRLAAVMERSELALIRLGTTPDGARHAGASR